MRGRMIPRLLAGILSCILLVTSCNLEVLAAQTGETGFSATTEIETGIAGEESQGEESTQGETIPVVQETPEASEEPAYSVN